MLKVERLSLQVNASKVINKVSMDIELGKNYALLGKNGSGKSSLAMAIMGNPNYKVTNGNIYLDGQNITDMPAHERARLGIFLAFQKIPEIPGVKLFEFLKTIYNASLGEGSNISFIKFKKLILPMLEEFDIDKEFLFRDLNVGFSGGEKRKIEILQLRLLKPKYIILDEIDSGLDINSIRQLGQMLSKFDTATVSFIIISHYFDLLNYLKIDKVFELEGGSLKRTGGKKLIDEIKKNGF